MPVPTASIKRPLSPSVVNHRFGEFTSSLWTHIRTKIFPIPEELSFVQAFQWCTNHYQDLRGALALPMLPPPESGSDGTVTADMHEKAFRTLTELFGLNANGALEWQKCKAYFAEASRWIQDNPPWRGSFTLADKGFAQQVDDSAWLAMAALEGERRENPEGYSYILEENARFAHLSILSCALCLESAANCALSHLNLSGKTGEDVDRLTPLGKFEVYLMARTGKNLLIRALPRSRAVGDLILYRNLTAHPKSTMQRYVRDGSNAITKGEMLPHLKIPRPRSGKRLTSKHSEAALHALFNFLTHYFLGLCGHKPNDMRVILYNSIQIDGYLPSQVLHQHNAKFDAAVKEWNLDIRVLCPFVSWTKYDGEREVEFHPGYPKDVKVYDGPRRYPGRFTS